jgi:hypothetical protein
MGTSIHITKASVASFFTTVVDRILGPEVAPVVENKALNLAQKQANIRAAGVRHGFKAILARGDEMAHRIETYKQHRIRHGEHQQTTIDPQEPTENIVLSSTEPASSRRTHPASA